MAKEEQKEYRVTVRGEELLECIRRDVADYTKPTSAWPAFLDPSGTGFVLPGIGKKEFSGKAGKAAFCDLMIARYQARKQEILRVTPAKELLEDKISREQQKLAALQARLRGMMAGEEE